MKLYIYLTLILLSISVSNVQATDNRSVEEIAMGKSSMTPALIGLVGGSLAARIALAAGGTKDPQSVFWGTMGGIALGGGWAESVAKYRNNNNTDNGTTNIVFWTSFIGLMVAKHLKTALMKEQ